MDQDGARRRPVLKAALGGVLAVGVTGGAVRWWSADAPSRPRAQPATLQLAADGGAQVSAVEVPLDTLLGGGVRGRVAGPQRAETTSLSSSPFSMLAATWDAGPAGAVAPALEVRTRSGGSWRDWRAVPALHDLPDLESGEGDTRHGTDLVWTGPSDGVQVRVTGQVPHGLRLLLLHPWAQPGDELDEPLARSASAATSDLVPRPHIRGRRHWGAQESWRDGQPRYNATIKQLHVHHTVSSNDYGRHDVPALLRGIYRYHTHYLGWSDIGYNFLVDRFGRIWTGRAGGASRPVRGAHTLGFNGTSTGVSVIGNFEVASPSSEVLDAIAALAAWKLPPFGRDPMTSIRVRSEGSDRFRRGRVVTLPVIDGHRDTNDTACPGRHLYHHLPEIRERTAHLVAYYSRVHVLEPAVLTGEPALGQTLTVDPGRYAPEDASLRYVWLRNDVRIEDAGAASYVVRPEDAGARLSVRVIARKPGLKPARRRLWSTRRVIAPATVDVYTVARGDGRLRVDVHVGSAPGVVVPTGRVVVEVAGHRAVVGLKDGHGFARFGWSRPLKAGRYRVRARYLGDRAHDPATGRARARVRR